MADLSIKARFLESLIAATTPYGLTFRKRGSTFLRRSESVTHIFNVNCVDRPWGYWVSPSLAIRIDAIEHQYHRISGSDRRRQQDTATLQVALADLLQDHSFYLSIGLESEPEAAAIKATQGFVDGALPFFAQYSSIEAVDALLNHDPPDHAFTYAPAYRGYFTALIAAKLSHRSDYGDLARLYTEKMRLYSNGSLLPKFLALVEALKHVNGIGPSTES